MRNRRRGLRMAALLALVSLMAACGSSDEAGSDPGTGGAGSMSLAIGTGPVVDFLPLQIAVEQGLFEKHGLTVTTTEVANGSAGLAALQGGSLDLTVAPLVAAASASEQGVDVQFVGLGTFQSQDHWSQALAVPTGGPTDVAAALAPGARVAVNSLTDPAVSVVKELAADAQVDPTKIEFVPVPFPDMVASLTAERVDAAMLSEPFLTVGGLDEQVSVVAPGAYQVLAPKVFQSGYITTPDWLASHEAAATAFTAAMDEAAAWIEANPSEAKDVLQTWLDLPPEVAQEVTLGEFAPVNSDPNAFDVVLAAAKDAGALQGEVSGQSLIYSPPGS